MSKIYATTSAKIVDWDGGTDFICPPIPYAPNMYLYDGRYMYFASLPKDMKNAGDFQISAD